MVCGFGAQRVAEVVHLFGTQSLSDLARQIEERSQDQDDRHARQRPRSSVGRPLGVAPGCADEEGKPESECEEEVEGPDIGVGRKTTLEQ